MDGYTGTRRIIYARMLLRAGLKSGQSQFQGRVLTEVWEDGRLISWKDEMANPDDVWLESDR